MKIKPKKSTPRNFLKIFQDLYTAANIFFPAQEKALRTEFFSKLFSALDREIFSQVLTYRSLTCGNILEWKLKYSRIWSILKKIDLEFYIQAKYLIFFRQSQSRLIFFFIVLFSSSKKYSRSYFRNY